MRASWRWGAWLGGLALLVGVPTALRAVPPDDSDLSAAEVLELVRDADGRAYSGQVETTGALDIPSVDDFDDVASLFGETSRLRVWWRSTDAWRVDRLSVAGEEDLVHDGTTTTSWDYEAQRVRSSRDPDIRLPRSSDLLPPDLAARAMSGDVTASRVEPRRVAGVDAVGVRIEPDDPASSVDHVLVWADPDTGLALDVEVYGGGSTPSFTSRFTAVSTATPSADTVAFDPPASADVSFEDALDIADAANQYAPLRPPASVGGLRRTSASDGAVGVYGTGLAQVLAVPLRDDDADALREQLLRIPGSQRVILGTGTPGGPYPGEGIVADVDALGIALTGEDGDFGYLVAGTVTRRTLQRAMADLNTGTRYIGEDQ